MFDVPVLVRRSTPLVPGHRPRPASLDKAHKPWPTPGNLAPDGLYLVTTTWRDVVDAAISVGRDPTAWLAAVPALAWSELVARRSPLIAYLGRAATGTASGYGLRVEPNVVYRQGTESSARSAFGYRIGMTMAEWACRGLMGLGPTTHAEAVTPTGAGPNWSTTTGLPDLVGYHPARPNTWLVEAKGQRKLTRRTLIKGAQQLSVPGLLDGHHMRVLCGTSLEHRLSMTIDVEEIEPDALSIVREAAGDPETDDDALLALARSRMLLYLCLSAVPASERRIVPVGAGVTDRAGRAPGGALTLLEHDASTVPERAAARRRAHYTARPGTERYDMLTGQVPGTDLIIGMSRRLFAACRNLSTMEQSIVTRVDRLRPAPNPDELAGLPDTDYESVNEERVQMYHQYQRQEEPTAADLIRTAFISGAQQTWETLLDQATPTRFTAPTGFLEAATTDTYLALNVQTVTR